MGMFILNNMTKTTKIKRERERERECSDRFESNSMGNRLLKGWDNTIVNQQLGAIPDAADVRKTFEKGWNGTGDVDTYGFA